MNLPPAFHERELCSTFRTALCCFNLRSNASLQRTRNYCAHTVASIKANYVEARKVCTLEGNPGLIFVQEARWRLNPRNLPTRCKSFQHQ